MASASFSCFLVGKGLRCTRATGTCNLHSLGSCIGSWCTYCTCTCEFQTGAFLPAIDTVAALCFALGRNKRVKVQLGPGGSLKQDHSGFTGHVVWIRTWLLAALGLI